MTSIPRLLLPYLLAILPLAHAASAATTSVAAERPDCPDGGPTPKALCACLTDQLRQEAGVEDPVMSGLECTVETYDEDAAVLAVGGYELHGFSYTLAIRTGDIWSPIASIGEKSTPGAGGHYSDFEVDSVRTIERGTARFLRVESRGSDGYWHFDGSQGFSEIVQVTLCRLPEAPGQPADCPLQAPILITRRWTDPDDSAESPEEEPGAGADESDPHDEHDEELEPNDREQEQTVRLEIQISADGTTAEVLLVEGDLKDGAIRDKLGRHSLTDK